MARHDILHLFHGLSFTLPIQLLVAPITSVKLCVNKYCARSHSSFCQIESMYTAVTNAFYTAGNFV